MLPEETAGSELATIEEEGSSLSFREYSTAPEFDKEDVQLPRLRIAQGLTPEVQMGMARPGQWVLTGYEPEESVTLIPLAYAKAREYRVDGELLCSSPNALVGRGSPGGACSACPMAQWQEKPDGKKHKPCSLVFSYVAYSITHGSPVVLEFKRTGERSARRLNTFIQARGLGNFALKVGAKPAQWGKNSGFEPTIDLAKVEPDVLEEARALPMAA